MRPKNIGHLINLYEPGQVQSCLQVIIITCTTNCIRENGTRGTKLYYHTICVCVIMITRRCWLCTTSKRKETGVSSFIFLAYIPCCYHIWKSFCLTLYSWIPGRYYECCCCTQTKLLSHLEEVYMSHPKYRARRDPPSEVTVVLFFL